MFSPTVCKIAYRKTTNSLTPLEVPASVELKPYEIIAANIIAGVTNAIDKETVDLNKEDICSLIDIITDSELDLNASFNVLKLTMYCSVDQFHYLTSKIIPEKHSTLLKLLDKFIYSITPKYPEEMI